MKKRTLLIAMIGMSFGIQAQNTFPANGNVGIGTTSTLGKLHIETNIWSQYLLTLKDTHYSPHQVYHFQIESDGLKIKQDNIINYQFKSGGNFIVNNGKVGIGTTNPSAKLEIKASGDGVEILKLSTERPWVFKQEGRGASSNLVLQELSGSKFFKIKSVTNEDVYWLHSSTGDSYLKGKLGIGTTNPGAWKLAVNGQIRAKEIKVETGWSDFVFENDYKLPTLQDVEKHIKEKGHLKDIPSAKEVEKNGIFLGEMNSKLLQKIEELTLYTIEQEKKIKKLESLNTKFIELKKRLVKLEKK